MSALPSSKKLTLAGEERVLELGWVNVGDGVVGSVPTAKARVETTHSRPLAVDDAELLVVGEVVDELAARVVRVTHDGNVVVQVLESVLCQLDSTGL